MRALLAAVAVSCLAFAAPGAAQAPPPVALALSAESTGWIAATVTAAPGQSVQLQDVGGAAPAALTTVTTGADGRAVVARAAAWSCARTRMLRAVALGTDGGVAAQADASITTPSCARRVAVTLRPAHPRAGRIATIAIADRWRVGGLEARVCTGEPGQTARTCRTVALAPGALRGAARFRVARPGRHPVSVRVAGGTVARTALKVLPRSSRLSVLAAGDSMMQVLDDDLHRRLAARGPVRVTNDAHISTGISKPFMLDWVAHAKATAAALRPDVSVVFLGANDGFGIGDAACCGGVWQARYAKRAGRMMRAYARGGQGTVYWLLLPVPRRPAFREIYAAVNRALRQAADRFPGVVHLVDLGAVFTPGGRFRQTMTWHGRRVSVRQADGVHLSVAGAGIAAEVVIRRMRADGLLPS